MSYYIIAKATYRVKVQDPVSPDDLRIIKSNFSHCQEESRGYFGMYYDLLEEEINIEVEEVK